MPISDVVSLVGGAALGAPFSEIFKLFIEEAKKVKDFKPLSQDLASTIERLVPVFQEIDLMQGGFDPSKGDLKVLIKTMHRAEKMIHKCSRVQRYNIIKKALYTREIKGINHDILKFCQIDLQLIQFRTQLQYRPSMPSVSMEVDLLSDTRNEFAEIFVVPQPETVTIFWLNQPLRKLKKMLFEDGVVNVVVSAPNACGKTMLVTKLCHDADVRGKFKQIFFITVSKAPNARLIFQRLLQCTGCKANEVANNLDGTPCIQQLLKQLRQSGSILLVLDDVWPEEESLLQNLLIQLPDYKILVTSRFEFPRTGPTFHLEPLIDEDIKNLFTECALPSNRQSATNIRHNLQKILKRCNGSPLALNPPSSICDGCNSVIEHERPVNVLGVLWHPECFCCDTCLKPIAIDEVENHVSNSRGKFHKSCYKKNSRRPNCNICKKRIPSTAEGIIYNFHPFWKENYCPAHEDDGTPKCCSCERLEPRGTNYVMLRDGRWLCLECMDSAVMDSDECQPLHADVRDFFEGLHMKIEKEFPLLLVGKQALNNDDKNYYMTRGTCLSEEQIFTSVSKGLATESHRVVRKCKVTAIHILYGYPRIFTGYILAHQMMHAWLRLNGYRNLNRDLEEGICEMLAHMWLKSHMYATLDETAADASSDSFSSSRTPPAIATSKKGDPSVYERKLAEFCKYQIENGDGLFGQGFKKVYEMMESNHYNLMDTLKDIVSISETPP